MEVLVLDGKNYVKASKAARELGYATDYVGQLCRGGKVDAHLIGRTWYVNQDELSTHKVEKKRMSRVKAREYAKKSIEEHRIKVQEKQNNYRNIDIHYESDTDDLIPKTKKLTVTTDQARLYERHIAPEDISEETTTLNKGERVIMSGDVTVVDVTDAPVDTDIITLTPTRIRHSVDTPHLQEIKQESIENETNEETGIEESVIETKPNFIDRVNAMSEPKSSVSNTPQTTLEVEKQVFVEESSPVIMYYILILILLVSSIMSIFVSSQISYSESHVDQNYEKFVFKFDTAIFNKIKLKI